MPTEIEISTLFQRLDGVYPREVVSRYFDLFEDDPEYGFPFLTRDVPWTLWKRDPKSPKRLATFERWCCEVEEADPDLYQRVLDGKTSSISRARRILRDRRAAQRGVEREVREQERMRLLRGA